MQLDQDGSRLFEMANSGLVLESFDSFQYLDVGAAPVIVIVASDASWSHQGQSIKHPIIPMYCKSEPFPYTICFPVIQSAASDTVTVTLQADSLLEKCAAENGQNHSPSCCIALLNGPCAHNSDGTLVGYRSRIKITLSFISWTEDEDGTIPVSCKNEPAFVRWRVKLSR